MNSVAPNHYSPADSGMSRHAPPQEMDRVISSTWHVLEQTPPPSLREVLGAYNSRGDGDRDMLIAMLNAKSAEDQRIASVAALHRTMLERQYAPPMSTPPALPPLHIHHDRHNYSPAASSSHPYARRPERRASAGSSGRSRSPAPASPSSHSSRKRRRTSRDISPIHTSDDSYSSTLHDQSPSPYASSPSASASSSPRSRASMTIGSLLSGKDAAPRAYTSDIRTSGYMSGTRSAVAA
ncbi:hypothetical protein FIBSPDRAFT_848634 [Athelia psychrophila]|uniref:Uncharacterized protein n=1 Tax=Athelia psychrophila TaxID=1759441 RepID=A0A166V195_9AGAM|nr:hypothetical protein FIBSPDRAFT_848634 [Fibularhizoctonia sp. CBS 109695]